ncbi:MAG: BREX system P-loop protein BrxC [Anaerolineaceae bacterium]|nr:BREX system P-loop protein BrxC [Anaerolineaceae bacterium]
MPTIRDLLSRDLSQPIEEVIKLDQRDEKTVHGEITEYVATQRIKEQYIKVLKPISEGPGDPTEAVGIWVSGFFGSGKSSFAKNLGYVLANRGLLGTPASSLFIQQLQKQSPGDPLVKDIDDLLKYINARYASHVVMFDVRVDRAVRRETVSIAEILYTVLLRELDYAQDFDIAELEIELEAEGTLVGFVKTCASLYKDEVPERSQTDPVPVTLSSVVPDEYAVWRMARKGAQKIQRASNVLHHLKPGTYPTPDSWAQSLHTQTDITIRMLVDRTFELSARREPKRAIMFIVDEVGQYVARSFEKIDNLRAVVEHFGQESKNRVLAGKAVAPVWIVVTSQEKLEEVVSAIGDKRLQLAVLQDRFHYRIDMAPSDIREVATKRVLSKRPEAEAILRDLYRKCSGQLATHTKPERSQIKFDVSEEDFVQFYPYLPHFVELSIDIISGMRLQPGAPRQIGGSNRTIIKQAYEMLVSNRTRLADAVVGELVTLDKIYDLVEGNLPSERLRDIAAIQTLWPDDPWPIRTAKAITLLEYVRGLPRTERNLAALLYSSLDAGSPLEDVGRAIQLLSEKQFIRQTEDGWKLLTDQEKSWSTERNTHSPFPKDRKEIWEDRLRTTFTEPGLSRYQLQKRTFRLGVGWEGRTLTQGDIPVELRLADSQKEFAGLCEDVRKLSRDKKTQVYWVFSSNDEIDDQVVELYRSQQMIGKYEQLRAQNKISPDEAPSLANEKLDVSKRQETLKRLITEAIQAGTGFFDGVHKPGPDLGEKASEIIKKMLDYAVPQLYSKLSMGNRPIKGTEADEILKAANLSGLSTVFYTTDGFGLVISQDSKYVINSKAPIANEVMTYLQAEHSYGNKVTGRMLEDRFSDLPYGWEREVLWLVMASLLRGGVIEVTYQGRRFRNHLDAQIRSAFSTTNAFRSASFAPRKAPDLHTLVAAAKRYEELTGEEVDVDEAAVAQAFQKLARAEMEALLPVEATVKANAIPVVNLLEEYRSGLSTILQGASDDVVNILEGEGESFKKQRQQVGEIRVATNEAGLNRLHRARLSVNQVWPLLSERGAAPELETEVKELKSLLQDGSYYRFTAKVDQVIAKVENTYQNLYNEKHAERTKAYQAAIEIIKGMSEWAQISDPTQPGALTSTQESILAPLQSRACQENLLGGGQLTCKVCGASMPQMESDMAAVEGLRKTAIRRVQDLVAPEEKIEHVRLSDVVNWGQTIENAEDVKQVVDELREYLLKLVASGAKVILE